MRARTFYTVAILLPAVALAAALTFVGRHQPPEAPLPSGVTAVWLYPPFAVRELATYGLVAAWLLWGLRRRSPSDFARTLWWAPPALVAGSALVLMPFVLVHGALRELLAENAARMEVHVIVQLAVAYTYIAITEFVRWDLLRIEVS